MKQSLVLHVVLRKWLPVILMQCYIFEYLTNVQCSVVLVIRLLIIFLSFVVTAVGWTFSTLPVVLHELQQRS